MAKPNEYVPGVCNIGNVEAANRRKTAIGAAALTGVTWIALVLLGAPAFAYSLIALPAFVAATAYIQSRLHFCAGFGAEGLYNFSNELGKTKQSNSSNDRAKDKKKAVQITVQATFLGIFTAMIAAATSLVLNQ